MPVPASKLRAFNDALTDLKRALLNEEDSADALFDLREVDPPTRSETAKLKEDSTIKQAVTLEQPRLELALAWIDQATPVSATIVVNGNLLPSSGTSPGGGLVFFQVPNDMVTAGRNRITYSLRFWHGGWKFQLWARVDGSRKEQLASGTDPSASVQDDRVIGAAGINL